MTKSRHPEEIEVNLPSFHQSEVESTGLNSFQSPMDQINKMLGRKEDA